MHKLSIATLAAEYHLMPFLGGGDPSKITIIKHPWGTRGTSASGPKSPVLGPKLHDEEECSRT